MSKVHTEETATTSAPIAPDDVLAIVLRTLERQISDFRAHVDQQIQTLSARVDQQIADLRAGQKHGFSGVNDFRREFGEFRAQSQDEIAEIQHRIHEQDIRRQADLTGGAYARSPFSSSLQLGVKSTWSPRSDARQRGIF
ncbi:hypothetical protein H261_17553 [Paramagnetospirillum caucaseum]|uniref:Uncharacterized protein n=1 Tax=Paramagnetospirillum caucaseum TaxID=1244869 RepID=M3A783_9PROT|nr:hypothetical protein H261_17553 [Paramagnetospirillum caucaseum]